MPACCSVVIVFLVAFSAIPTHFLAIVWVNFRDFDGFPFFVAAIDTLTYWSVNFNVLVRVFAQQICNCVRVAFKVTFKYRSPMPIAIESYLV